MEFVDPSNFDSDEDLIEHIIQNIVIPSLQDQIGPEFDFEGIHGMAYVFGGKGREINADTMNALQEKVQNGMPFEYAVREMSDLHLIRQKEIERGNLVIHYVELEKSQETVEDLSVEDLEEMFSR